MKNAEIEFLWEDENDDTVTVEDFDIQRMWMEFPLSELQEVFDKYDKERHGELKSL